MCRILKYFRGTLDPTANNREVYHRQISAEKECGMVPRDKEVVIIWLAPLLFAVSPKWNNGAVMQFRFDC